MNKYNTTLASFTQTSPPLNPCICTACGRRFETEAGTNSHLSQSRNCAWYRKGKIPDLSSYMDDEDYNDDLPNSDHIDSLSNIDSDEDNDND